ncbi:MAG: substrate-binding domain-containing protein, partial [Planctomycetota bacterium]
SHPQVTAVICYAARETNPLLIAAASLGRRVPEELSVITFAAGKESQSTYYDGLSLSLMSIPLKATGIAAVTMLNDLINDPERECPSRAMPYNAPSIATIRPPVSV